MATAAAARTAPPGMPRTGTPEYGLPVPGTPTTAVPDEDVSAGGRTFAGAPDTRLPGGRHADGQLVEGLDVTAQLAGMQVVLQPIVEVATGRLALLEALARFRNPPAGPPDAVIAAARATGLGTALEAGCVDVALRLLPQLPAGVRLTVNLSPAALSDLVVDEAWTDRLADVVVEVTELDESPSALAQAIERLRLGGAAVAADDVGSGFSGLSRLAAIRPDYVKVDRSIVTGAQQDPGLLAVLEALTTFSHRIGACVIAEGVETLDQLRLLAALDVDLAQGWAVGRPAETVDPVPADVVTACRRARLDTLHSDAPVAVAANLARATHVVTGALSRARSYPQLDDALRLAARALGVDAISVSLLGEDGVLHETATTTSSIDRTGYPLVDYPLSARVVRDGATVEVHVDDSGADAAEVALLAGDGIASLLIAPLVVAGRGVGIMEFAQHTPRRWSSQVVAQTRGLAGQTGVAIERLGARRPSPCPRSA